MYMYAFVGTSIEYIFAFNKIIFARTLIGRVTGFSPKRVICELRMTESGCGLSQKVLD